VIIPLKAGNQSPFFFTKGLKIPGNPITETPKPIKQIKVMAVGR
jgi:hypothetical protein